MKDDVILITLYIINIGLIIISKLNYIKKNLVIFKMFNNTIK